MSTRASIYLDWCASAPLHPAARDAMLDCLSQGRPGHASSVHQHGRAAEALVSTARSRLARLIGCRTSELVFTGSGTESNNLAILGAAQALRQSGRGAHLIISAIEHEAVEEPCRRLESQGFEVSRIPCSPTEGLDLAALESALTPRTALVSIMAVNHETGLIMPLKEVVRLSRKVGAWVHTDASVAIGRISCTLDDADVDLMTLSGHKFGGPQGIGALYIRRGLKLVSQLVGGPQERKRRAGAENVLGIVGMGAAAAAIDLPAQQAVLTSHTRRLLDVLQQLDACVLNGTPSGCPGIVNASIAGIEGESLLMNLDLAGISISSGAPCSSGSLDPSPVLLALGFDEARARSAVRFSPGWLTTGEELETALALLPVVVERLRRLKPAAPRSSS